MSGSSAHLTLHPDRCDQCLRCVRACPDHALKVAVGYIYVDRLRCTGCDACVKACERGAIERREARPRSGAADSDARPGDVGQVVVGSRAEAKAVRKAAQTVAKTRAKAAEPSARTGKPARLPAPPSRAAAPVKRTSTSAPKSALGAASWTLVDAAAVLAVLLLTLLLKNLALSLGFVQLMPQTGRTAVRALVLAAFYSLQLGAFAWLAWRHGAGLLSAFGLRRADGERTPGGFTSALGSAGLVVALFLGTETITLAYVQTMDALGVPQPVRLSSDLSAVFGRGGVGLVLSGLLVVLVAPLAEELAFRGVLASALRDRWGMWPAIVVSSAVFAGYHLSAWFFFPTFVLGMALGWLAFSRRSLVPAIALHVVYNAAAVAAAFLVAR